jgi:phosphatidylserine/phosphatidylglycerophosphate/cardiolipin synthase-like enzyme
VVIGKHRQNRYPARMKAMKATVLPPQARRVLLRLLRDGEHSEEILERGVRLARHSVWIATANLKDVHVQARIGTRARAAGRYLSLFEELIEVAGRGVEVRILHAGTPSRSFASRIQSAPQSAIMLRQCPRVHLKMIAVDGVLLYLGSANFTGAGLGSKGDQRRNFEAGVVTDDDWMLDQMQATFDAIWRGQHCPRCQRRRECPQPLDGSTAVLGTMSTAPTTKKPR